MTNMKEYHQKFCGDVSCKLIHGRAYMDTEGNIRNGRGPKMSVSQAWKLIRGEA